MCKKLICLTLIPVVLVLANNTTADMVAYYPMDEGEGIDVADITSNGNDGTIIGTPKWVEGMTGYGTALEFPGEAGSYVATGTWDPSEGTGQVSVTAWINWAGATDTYQGILSKTDGVFNQMRWQLTLNTGDFTIGYGGGTGAPTWLGDAPPIGQWQHIAFSHNGTTVTIYIDGVAIGSTDIPIGDGVDAPLNIGTLSLFGIGDAVFNGIIDDVKIFNSAISESEVQQAMLATSKDQAFSPKPKNNAVDVLHDVILSWKPGEYADKHDVYLGTIFNDVNNADAGSPLLVGPAQDANSYNAGRLEFGQTYYWRIDEVNAPPDLTVYRGDIWSFTVEPYAIPIVGENINATASSQAEGQGPENTINQSGLVDDLHSFEIEDMWISSNTDTGPVWIQFEFDKLYKLHEMLVWNYNGDSILSGLGLRNVTIEYSTDGTSWTQLDGTHEFAQAPGTNGYTSDITVNFDGTVAKFVKINAISNWFPNFSLYGLSEVRFMTIPVFAREPSPESETTDVAVVSSLAWRAGREAAEHYVSLSTDQQAVINGTAPRITIDQTSYSPTLDLGNTYYWRIDEVNNAETPTTWPGDIWSFSTQDYLIVDDFEAYNDIAAGEQGSNLVYNTWMDGITNPSKGGSQIGYFEGYSLETDIVHGGNQSVPLFYDNTSSGSSEVTANTIDLTIGRDWSIGSPQTLVIWIHGDLTNNANDRLYAKIGNTKEMFDGDLSIPIWKQWNIDLTGMNLNNVTTFSIGIEGSGSGMILLDDIMLYRYAPSVVQPVDPGTDNLLAQYAMENNLQDSSGNNLNGTANGFPTYIQGLPGYGMALSLDGDNDYIDLPIGPTISTLTDCTITTWVNWPDDGGDWQRIFDIGTGTTVNMFLTPSNGAIMRFAITTGGSGGESQLNASDELLSGWHHVAIVIDGTNMTMELYLDAQLVASSVTEVLPAELGETTNNWLGRSQYSADAYFLGSLDDFRIYNTVMSEGQVRYIAGDR